MNNQPTATSGQSSSAQPTPGSTSGATGSSSSGGEGAVGSLNGAGGASSAFSRGLAMLTVDSDADEGEMGRLQALLEARGLPPHRKKKPIFLTCFNLVFKMA